MPEISPEQWDTVVQHIGEANTKLDSIDRRLATHSKRLDSVETVVDRWNGGKAALLGLVVVAGAIGGVVMGIAAWLRRGG